LKTQARAALAALLLGTCSLRASGAESAAEAATETATTRFYAGGALGGSTFDLPATDPPPPAHSAKSAAALKAYFGYRLGPYFGVEGGYARLGSLSRWSAAAGGSVEQKSNAQVFYAAAAGRWPISAAFALNGRLGLASGRISDTARVLPDAPTAAGRTTGLMLGVGAEYSLSQRLALTADYDHFDKLSKASKGGMLTLGLRASF